MFNVVVLDSLMVLVLLLLIFRSPVQLNVALEFTTFVPQRNCYIKSVVLFEGDSIVLLPECLEASGVEFSFSIGFQSVFDRISSETSSPVEYLKINKSRTRTIKNSMGTTEN